MVTVIKHAPHEGLGSFEAECHKAGHAIELIDATAAGAAQWQAARDAEILFVMGGAMGVYESDRFSFLRDELELLASRIARDLPTFGVCLGSQLIATASGGRVFPSGRHEIGWFKVQPTEQGREDSVVGPRNWSEPVFHWHGDTFDTPPGATHLLSSERFTQQGFRLGRRIYALQFHPEITAEDLPLWLASEPDTEYGRADGVQSQDEILDGGRRFGAALQALSGGMIQRFLSDISR
ncbi:MAG: gamma-glutamyl-gamma-aminobutyrate hydrolase family protein [Deltaproteobacteria bacterium]|nr:gamma-glutamyl-gamma-aminobutyrate hydrolase family protein [Deltaproteobacteria bacterium]